jgi:hypothetical protein
MPGKVLTEYLIKNVSIHSNTIDFINQKALLGVPQRESERENANFIKNNIHQN